MPSGVPVPLAAHFTSRERALRVAASWAAYLACIALSVTLQTAVLLLRSSLQESMSPSISGGVIAALLNALVVEVLGALYKPLVHVLVRFQNYRSAVAHEYHYSVQLFVVLFANRFYSLFYLAMLKGVSGVRLFAPANGDVEEVCRDRRGAASDDCMEELFVQIVALLALDLLVKHVSKLGGLLWTAMRHPPGAARVAHEATLPEGPPPAEDFSDLAMSFAMVVLFSGACPLAAGAALMSNAIEGRCDVYKYLRASRRYESRAVADIGAWYMIFQVICYAGMLTNVVIICYTSTELPKLLTVQQVGGHATHHAAHHATHHAAHHATHHATRHAAHHAPHHAPRHAPHRAAHRAPVPAGSRRQADGRALRGAHPARALLPLLQAAARRARARRALRRRRDDGAAAQARRARRRARDARHGPAARRHRQDARRRRLRRRAAEPRRAQGGGRGPRRRGADRGPPPHVRPRPAALLPAVDGGGAGRPGAAARAGRPHEGQEEGARAAKPSPAAPCRGGCSPV